VSLESFTSRVTQFSASLATLAQKMQGQEGVASSSNCSVLKQRAQQMTMIFCNGFLSELQKVAICSLILMILTVLTVLFVARNVVIFANLEMVKLSNE
jgi:hypothetical protein